MLNPFEDFLPFLSALFDHLITLLAGCFVTVMIGVLEKRVLKRPISLRLEAAVFLSFVFFACFQAWREQYRVAQQVPPLSAKVKDQDTEILNLKTNPPHVEVNVPTPIVNVPPQMAYIGTFNTGIVAPSYKIGGNLAVSSGCKNLSASVVAEKVSCVIGLRVVDTKFNAAHQPIVTAQVQEKTWTVFKNDMSSTVIGYKDYGPTEGDFKTVWTPVIDEALDRAFVGMGKTLMLLGEYKWRDGLGEHTNEYCVWLQNTPGLFSPGAMNPNIQFAWHSCEKHYGLKR